MNNAETNRVTYNVILIHVARAWERTRLKQPFEEMPIDNIESTETIGEIATLIYNNEIVQGFLKSGGERDYWLKHTNEMSDTYIEREALEFINNEIIQTQEGRK